MPFTKFIAPPKIASIGSSISGASMILRPGIQMLLQDAQAGQFDMRAHQKKNRLNGARRPKSLLSGLVFCGCRGGPYSLRGDDRFTCSNHISKGSCSNSRGIAREDLERRALLPTSRTG